MSVPFDWTPDKIATFRKMWADGTPNRLIGAALSTSHTVVAKQADALGLPSRDRQHVGRGAVKVSLPKKRTTLPVAISSDAFIAPPGDYTIDLQDLRSRGDCRWPYGERAPYQFCGRPATDGVYCEGHGKIAFRSAERPSAVERRIASAGLRMKCEGVHA